VSKLANAFNTITMYVQVLRSWGEPELADHFNTVGRKLLSPTYDPRKDRETTDSNVTAVEEMQESLSYVDLGVDESESKSKDVDVAPKTKNAELNALELTIQKINKQRKFTYCRVISKN